MCGEILLNIFAPAAELEADMISERMLESLHAAKMTRK